MNIDDLRNEWDQQFGDTESTSEIVLKLFRESRQGKIQDILQKLVFHSVLFMVFNLVVLVGSSLILVEAIANMAIVIPAALMIALSSIVFYMNVTQLDLIRRIDFSHPILQLQMAIERLKLKRIRHNRFIFITCILYFWLAVTLMFRWDLTVLLPAVWSKAPIVVIVHLGMLLIWFPASLWILRVYDSIEGRNSFWKWLERDSYLTDNSLNASLNGTLSYIKELHAFDEGEAE